MSRVIAAVVIALATGVVIGARSSALSGFLPGGCPALTEDTRKSVNMSLLRTLAANSIATIPQINPLYATDSHHGQALVRITSLALSRSSRIPCGVSAHWTATLQMGDTTQNISGDADLAISSSGAIDANSLPAIDAWVKSVPYQIWSDYAEYRASSAYPRPQ